VVDPRGRMEVIRRKVEDSPTLPPVVRGPILLTCPPL
jgi:hypothetical protein